MASQCRARVSLPNSSGEGDVLFTCNRPKHAPVEGAVQIEGANTHREAGRVRAKNGTTYYYTVEWVEAPAEVWRVATPQQETHDPHTN